MESKVQQAEKMSRTEIVSSGEISALSTDMDYNSTQSRSCAEPTWKTDFSNKFYGNYMAAESLHDMGFRIFPLWGITEGKCDCVGIKTAKIKANTHTEGWCLTGY